MVFLVNFARVVFAPLLDPFRAAFGITSEGAVGLIATLAWVGSALPRIPTGYLLTRVPRHRVVLGTGVVLTVATTFTAFAGSLTLVYLGAFLMGLASGAYFIAANPLVSELFPERVGRAIGIHGMSSQLAAVGAPLFVGLVLLRESWQVPGLGELAAWRVVMLTLAVVAAVTTVAFYRVASRSAMPTAGADDRNLLVALKRQWRIILTGVVVLGGTGFVWNGLFNLYVRYLSVAKGLAPAQGRTLLTLVFLAGVPAFFLTGDLADRIPHVPLLLGVLGAFAGCLLALTYVSGFLPIVVVTLVLGYVVHSTFPAMDTFLLGSLPDENRASAYALYSGVVMLVGATGSVTVGALVDLGLQYDEVYRGFAVILVAILGILVVLYRLDRLPTGAD
ncbi:MFS transporter [Haloarchaeobius sp. HME9146]|uniref:MFS transporter n=1 Tax=Haloarchaeobius sp. HME9146 TaxID=2978732 RepID=UPI0021BFAD29|nr:MFS transporter [Haloarchaeobius sp. HME9146]MCT9095818.1 MFS transporter [Haloarchaeobius sp. HME9146]